MDGRLETGATSSPGGSLWTLEQDGELGSAWAVREGFLEKSTSKLNTSTTDGSLRVYLDAPCSLQTKLLTTASGDPT